MFASPRTHPRGNAAGGTAVPTVASFRESLLGEKDHKDPGPHARGVVTKRYEQYRIPPWLGNRSHNSMIIFSRAIIFDLEAVHDRMTCTHRDPVRCHAGYRPSRPARRRSPRAGRRGCAPGVRAEDPIRRPSPQPADDVAAGAEGVRSRRSCESRIFYSHKNAPRDPHPLRTMTRLLEHAPGSGGRGLRRPAPARAR